MKTRLIVSCVCALLGAFPPLTNAALPVPSVELRFSETQMPLGSIDSIVHLTGGEYVSFGIDVSGAYRYHDDRDPFSDGIENQGGNPYGIALDFGPVARVDFLTPVSNLEVDWWTITGTMYLDVFSTSGDNIHSLTGSSTTGSTDVVPLDNISYLEFHDSGGYVQISNLRFEPIPEPTTCTLLGLGSLALVMVRRRR